MARASSAARRLLALAGMLFLVAAGTACGGDDAALTVYSGRTQSLIQPLLERFAEEAGLRVQVRYGDTAELAATIREEGDNTPADVFVAQDAGALGALADAGALAPLPEEVLSRVDPRFRSPAGEWVGLSGRARVVAYSPERVDGSELPGSILGFTDERWRGRIGWAPTNGSFQSFVTALRLLEGDDAARDWLEGIAANDPVEYTSNLTAVDGVADAEVDVAFVNHYYLHVLRAEEGEDYPVENAYLGGGDAGALVNVAGAGVLERSDRAGDARRLIEFLLTPESQRYFAEETFEYPLVGEVEPGEALRPLSELDPPDLDLSDLDDLQGTLDLMREAGVLP